jgi:phage shock protein A
MGMFSRMSDIVQANINSMLDKAEDPEKVIRLIIQEMEETLVEIRSVAAKNLAEQKHIDRKVAQLQKQVQMWQNKAKLAVEKGRDDLARAALNEKHQADAKVVEAEQGKQQIDELITAIQDDTFRLQAKLTEARSKQKSLAARKQTSAVRLQAKQVANSEAVFNAVERFEQYEHRVETLEAQVDAFEVVTSATSLEQEFADLVRGESIEAELTKLKAKVTGASTAKTAKSSSSKAA